MFVDDDQIQQTAIHPNQPAEEVAPPSQEALDYWVGFLGSTGGAINPEKSYWYMLDWEWVNNTWKPRTSPQMPGELTAVDPHRLTKPLRRLEPTQAFMQLGILLAPNGSQIAQFEHLKAKAHAFASNIQRQGLLTRNEVWTNLTLSVNKTLECPMVTTRFPRSSGTKSPPFCFKQHFPRLVLSKP